MTPLRDNVQHALCYHNNAPLMFGLGGGLAVDYDPNLHARTLEAVRKAAA